VAYAP